VTAWRFFERWEWLMFSMLAISMVVAGAIEWAAFFALLAIVKLVGRSTQRSG
jgi:hypothetical protein